MAHTVQYHEVILQLNKTTHTTSFHKDCLCHLKYRDLKCLTEDAVLMYSGIAFQIKVPEKMNQLRNNSVLGLGA